MRQGTITHVMQDGRNFYCYHEDPVGVLDAEPFATFTSIIRVRDGDIDDARAARDWFMIAIAFPNDWLAIKWVA